MESNDSDKRREKDAYSKSGILTSKRFELRNLEWFRQREIFPERVQIVKSHQGFREQAVYPTSLSTTAPGQDGEFSMGCRVPIYTFSGPNFGVREV